MCSVRLKGLFSLTWIWKLWDSVLSIYLGCKLAVAAAAAPLEWRKQRIVNKFTKFVQVTNLSLYKHWFELSSIDQMHKGYIWNTCFTMTYSYYCKDWVFSCSCQYMTTIQKYAFGVERETIGCCAGEEKSVKRHYFKKARGRSYF